MSDYALLRCAKGGSLNSNGSFPCKAHIHPLPELGTAGWLMPDGPRPELRGKLDLEPLYPPPATRT
jgi:hypothetical protein